MEKVVRYTKEIIWYDGPQIFESEDASGNLYIGLLVEENKYIFLSTTRSQWDKTIHGQTDFRTFVLESVTNGWYEGNNKDDEDYGLTKKEGVFPEEYLPGEGIYF